MTVAQQPSQARTPSQDDPPAHPKQPEDPAPAGKPTVLAAVDLGWCMAELYAKVKPDVLQPPEMPDKPLPHVRPRAPENLRIQLQDDLPGLGHLPDRQEKQLLIDRIDAGLHKIKPVIVAAGLPVPDRGDWVPLAYHQGSAEGRYQLARSVLQFHGDLLMVLTASDYQVGLAYGLGRALADMALRPQADKPYSLTDDLSEDRVKTISGWLGELRGALPAHSVGAVMGSIAQWQQWAASPTWDGEPLKWDDHSKDVVSLLRRQGKRWQLLLTGQVAALDQLGPEDYVQASGYMIGRIRQILQQVLVQYWPWVTVITVVMLGAVVGSLLLLNSAAAKGIGVAVSVFGWLGVTGRSVSGELQRTVSQVEQSLWGGELDLAAAWANTLLPDADANRQIDEARAPRSRLGQAAIRLVIAKPQSPRQPGRAPTWLHRRAKARQPAPADTLRPAPADAQQTAPAETSDQAGE